MTPKLSRVTASLDVIQGISGFCLVIFLWLHMFFVSSILISKDAMYWVTKFFEGEMFFAQSYPIIVSLTAFVIFLLVLIHAAIALKKFPANYRQYHAIVSHMKRLNHGDTWLWGVQLVTGFILLFLVGIHLYQLMLHPADIGPYASSDRVWSHKMWPLYLLLLLSVELHAGIGIYRLAIKWGWFIDKKPKQNRRRWQKIKWLLTTFFITLGVITLLAYMKIGYEHADKVGERYVPSSVFSERQQ
ncbi:fumarate reductase cytochrome b subunit [Thalassotalea aquiviva]|uniref:fumarate reductase cytochrome b subunit n=1 Tax=Thalassotalea aquiviva TaxID=3242415 RepID=UPI00352AE30A